MSQKQFKWAQALDIQESDLAAKPAEQGALHWALAEKKVNENQALAWVSENHQIPALRPEFFTQSLDMNLIAKFSSLYNWNESCFPVAFSNDTLVIACVEPVELNSQDIKHCFVVAPYSAMVQAWSSMSGQFHVIENNNMTSQPNVVKPQQTDQPQTQAPTVSATESVDFSSIAGSDSMETTQTMSAQNAINPMTRTEPISTTEDTEPLEQQNQVADFDFNFDELKQQAGVKEPNTVAAETVSNPDGATVVSQPSTTQVEPALNSLTSATQTVPSDTALGTTIPAEQPILHFDDPSLLKQKQAPPQTPAEEYIDEDTQPEINLVSNTLTEAPEPSHVPIEHLISEADKLSNKEFNEQGLPKDAIAHMFHHMEKDYQKVMWIEKDSEGVFYPKYVDNNWHMSSVAWQMHINLAHPNIFRISFNSRQPFHGQVSVNAHNLKYFEWWTQGNVPNFVTIYPAIVNEDVVGFLVAFDKTENFDELNSLKKAENLMAICQKALNPLAQLNSAA